MTVANLKIGRRNFVVVPERDFDRMQLENKRYRQLVEEDRAMGELAEKELKTFRKAGGKGIPWEKVRKELGL
jgi:PHD/YefM family antitoxin component YafN of YafNO toxin-antitoxin module